jgi:hypothetical protein
LIPQPDKAQIEAFSIALCRTSKEKNIGLIDALVHICQIRSIEPEVAATLLDDTVKQRLQIEAEKLNLMKVKRKRLPIR